MKFDPADNGFLGIPDLVLAAGAQKLYRAWGGHPGRKWGNLDRDGVCFGTARPAGRGAAERLYAIMEYGNPALYLTEFSVAPNTPMWVGKVHPGDPRAVLGTAGGTQVFIERCWLGQVSEGATTLLANDMGGKAVYLGPAPRLPA